MESHRDMLAPYERHRDEGDGRIRGGIERHRKADAVLRRIERFLRLSREGDECTLGHLTPIVLTFG